MKHPPYPFEPNGCYSNPKPVYKHNCDICHMKEQCIKEIKRKSTQEAVWVRTV